jgi:hypothetical protein
MEDTWIEYGEARVRVFHAIESRPQDGFTLEALSTMLALPLYEVKNALAELSADNLVVWTDDVYASALRFD